MEQIRAVVVDPAASGRLVIRPVPAPSPLPSEALVRGGPAGTWLAQLKKPQPMAPDHAQAHAWSVSCLRERGLS